MITELFKRGFHRIVESIFLIEQRDGEATSAISEAVAEIVRLLVLLGKNQEKNSTFFPTTFSKPRAVSKISCTERMAKEKQGWVRIGAVLLFKLSFNAISRESGKTQTSLPQ